MTAEVRARNGLGSLMVVGIMVSALLFIASIPMPSGSVSSRKDVDIFSRAIAAHYAEELPVVEVPGVGDVGIWADHINEHHPGTMDEVLDGLSGGNFKRYDCNDREHDHTTTLLFKAMDESNRYRVWVIGKWISVDVRLLVTSYPITKSTMQRMIEEKGCEGEINIGHDVLTQPW